MKILLTFQIDTSIKYSIQSPTYSSQFITLCERINLKKQKPHIAYLLTCLKVSTRKYVLRTKGHERKSRQRKLSKKNTRFLTIWLLLTYYLKEMKTKKCNKLKRKQYRKIINWAKFAASELPRLMRHIVLGANISHNFFFFFFSCYF